MQTNEASTINDRRIKPYRGLRDRILAILPECGGHRGDVYNAMALLIRRSFGESVFRCKCGDWMAQIVHARQQLGENSAHLFELLTITHGPEMGRHAKFFYDDRACGPITVKFEEDPDEWRMQALLRTRQGIGLFMGHRIIADANTSAPRQYLRQYIADESLQLRHVWEQLQDVFQDFPDNDAAAYHAFYERDGWEVSQQHSDVMAHFAAQLREAWSNDS
jgi:hypothetical protein